MDFAKKAQIVYDAMGRGSNPDIDSIEKALKEAWNEAIEKAERYAEKHKYCCLEKRIRELKEKT